VNAAQLIVWFDAHARDLPWREAGTTPWGVLVSEVMLQQTPVRRVAGVWTEWMARWPTPSSLAAETPGAAVRAWGKLGYPRRALRLHEAAVAISSRHDDVVPADVDVLLTLPGIGAYTARAVAAFGYGHRVPVVDTNVRRVVARAVRGMADPAAPSTSRDLSARGAGRPLLRRADGARRPGVHRSQPALRRLSGGRRVRLGARRQARRNRPGPTRATLRGH
jgi:A/G-specific adenine glycosylase